MKIMVDSNVLISAALYHHGVVWSALREALSDNVVIVTAYVKAEVIRVAELKFPERIDEVNELINSDIFEQANPEYLKVELDVSIRDIKDVPVYLSAKVLDVDILMTGDKDLFVLECDKPRILSPAEYLFMVNKLA